MSKRYVSIWFRFPGTDSFARHQPGIRNTPFILISPVKGKMIVSSANELARKQGIVTGMTAADARAILPTLSYFDENREDFAESLVAIAKWCIRFTPIAAIDPPDGIILDVTGCAHLWGGETNYLKEINYRLKKSGFDTRISIADTIGAAWAIARYGEGNLIIKPGEQMNALLPLPPAALRISPNIIERLEKLGLRQLKNIISMPGSALKRRFGQELISKLNQALGFEMEMIEPVIVPEPYQERLSCFEPIITATGIEIALKRLLESLCLRLQQEQKGVRTASFKVFRTDGKMEIAEIGTNRATSQVNHLYKLFELKLPDLAPEPGIELFILSFPKVEEIIPFQEKCWEENFGLDEAGLAELMDRVANKMGPQCIHRYLPDEHYWPERSIKLSGSLQEKIKSVWRIDKPRPIQLLSKPEPVEVAAPIPDYPPMLFRYKGTLHTIKKADGPERIEREWWAEEGPHRDYYCVEDEFGHRYWLFRSGHYSADKKYQWFIHGFFA